MDATKYSYSGLVAVWRYEAAFRQEIMLSMILIPLACWFGRGAVEIVLLVGSCILVLLIEVLNSAVEAVVDRVGSEFHELSGRAKDLGSLAVLISLVNVVFVWGMILGSRLC